MRNVISAFLVLVISLFAVSQTANQKGSAATTEQEVRTAVAQCLAAGQKGDFASLTKIIADDFIGTTFDGKVIYKDDIVVADGSASFPAAVVQDVEVRTLGDTAVAIGTFVFEQKDAGKLRFTEVWTKRSGGWQLVVAHLSHA
jgi:ketosteroid isomerase-like protein